MLPGMKSIVWAMLVWTVIQWVVQEKVLRARRRLPPGPTPLPIIGNFHNMMTKKPHKTLAELAKIHGPLMLLRLGYLNMVVVSSPEVARQVLHKKEAHFSDRWVPDCIRIPNIVDCSISMAPSGHRWRTNRKITSNMLFSKKALDGNQHIRMKKIKDLVSYVSSCCEKGVVVNLGQLAFRTGLNLLSNTLFSMDLADSKSELSREFTQLTLRFNGDFEKTNLADFFPFLRSLDPQGLRRQLKITYTKMFNIMDTIIHKRLAARNDGEPECNDILDALLKICQDTSEDFELRHIHPMLLELIIGGSETPSAMIEHVMEELFHEPIKLKTVQNELHRVVGRGNFIKEADFAQLPYLQAIVKETFRLHPAGPILFPRKADSDIEVCGFTIPKDSMVVVNAWAIGRDSNVWNNPNIFEPERFLESQIDVKGRHFELIPFGSGRRICVGMPLVTRMLPLVLGNLLNFFEWKLPDGVKSETMDSDDTFGIVLKRATPLLVIPTNVIS